MHKSRKADARSSSSRSSSSSSSSSRSSRQRREAGRASHATAAECTGLETGGSAVPAAQIRLLVETDSTQTDDELLQELLRRRRVYLNEQSQLGGQESESVVKAHEEADQIFAQATRRAREEAMKTVDASTCLKAALWNGVQHHGHQRERVDEELVVTNSNTNTSAVAVMARAPTLGDADPALQHTQGQACNQSETAAQAVAIDSGSDVGTAAPAPAPARKNTRGFRLGRR